MYIPRDQSRIFTAPFWTPEVGIYKRKQEIKKKRQKELDQESDREKKQGRKQDLDQESDQEKKKVFSFFLGRFLGRERVFFIFFLLV